MTAKAMFHSRINNGANLIDDVSDSNNSFYVAIGKADAWSNLDSDFVDDNLFPELVNGATRSLTYEAQVRQNFLAMKKLTLPFVTHGIRRYDWSSGTVYTQWDSDDSDIFTKVFYVITDENRVYKCINAPATGSTVQPTHTNTTPTTELDGYTWRYMYTVSSVQVTRFLNNVYIPVKTVPNAGLSTEDDIQYANQISSNAIKGKIYSIKVVNGGSAYTTATVEVDGDGTGCTANAVIVGGVVTEIQITAEGDDYNVAKVNITGDGTGAQARAILSPPNGHGSDPVNELGGEFIMASFTLQGDEGGSFIVDDDFRQVSFIKNPFDFNTTTIATSESINAVPTMRLSSVTNGPLFTEGNIGTVISDSGDPSIKAFVVSYDEATGDLQYTQNDKTGYKNFVQGNTITSTNGATGTIATLSQATPDVDIHSGQLLIVDNIQAVNRTLAGQESLTFIIQH